MKRLVLSYNIFIDISRSNTIWHPQKFRTITILLKHTMKILIIPTQEDANYEIMRAETFKLSQMRALHNFDQLKMDITRTYLAI